MARTTRPRLSEVRVRTATAHDTKHGRQLFDGLGSNGLYLHVTPNGAKCRVQRLMAPNAATGKSRRVRIGFGAGIGPLAATTISRFDRVAAQCRDAGCSGGTMTLEEWIAETEAERPERALWPSETDARRFRDVWCTGRERLESNAWNDEDAVAFWWLVKSNGSTVTVSERDEVLRGALVPGTMQNWS